MEKREYSDIEVYELLCRIDKGYEPNEAEAEELTDRIILDLSGAQIAELPKRIVELKSLQALDLSRTRISELPESIGELKSLQRLNLGGTQISELPESIGELKSLQALDLSETQISELPDSIVELKNLQRLDLSGTWISEFPESIVELKSLRLLDLSGTQISELPESIVELKSLQALDLSGTQISELPEFLGGLPALRTLDLVWLDLNGLPESLIKCGLPFVNKERFYVFDEGINLHNTTLSEQDISVFLEAPELAEDLYTDQEPIRESKVIFLGDGGVGKTYSIRRILEGGKKESEDAPYNTKETQGAEIKDYRVERGENSFDIHFWDFGGQELLHSMHRCFLTDNTCYVVLVTSRNNDSEKRARFWLRNIKAFAPNSPILLFVNRWDQGDDKRVIDETRLKKDYAQIRDVVYCSAKDASEEDFKQIVMDRLISMAEEFGTGKRTANRKWMNVCSEIREENGKQSYLTQEQYHAICENNGIKNDKAPALLTFFNNIGVCFSYHCDKDRKEFAEYKLLSPVWLTNALYAIIEEGINYADFGMIKQSGIEQMLYNQPSETINDRPYSRTAPQIRYDREKNECKYILEVAQMHDLCYKVDNESLFFPALCKKETPEEALEEPEGFPRHVEYRFEYKYLPDSVVHQLMIRCLKKDLSLNYRWLRGMVLGGMNNHKVYVRMADDDETLLVDVYSKIDHPACEVFPLIRNEVREINSKLNLKAREVITDNEDRFTLVSLIQAHRSGAKSVFGDDSGSEFSPLDLLERFYDSLIIPDMTVEHGDVLIKPYEYHRCKKENPELRRALFDVHGEKCRYCNKPLSYDEMQVDHVLAKEHLPSKDHRVEIYLAQLKDRGFDIDAPDYIENYLPSCGFCNRGKSNVVRDVEALRNGMHKAMEKLPAVLEYMKKFKAKRNG